MLHRLDSFTDLTTWQLPLLTTYIKPEGDAPLEVNIGELWRWLLVILGWTLGPGLMRDIQKRNWWPKIGWYIPHWQSTALCSAWYQAKRHAQGVAELSYAQNLKMRQDALKSLRSPWSKLSNLKSTSENGNHEWSAAVHTHKRVARTRHCWLHGICSPHCQLETNARFFWKCCFLLPSCLQASLPL